MPLGLTVPAWYNDNYYINEKVDECNTIKFGAVEGEEFTPWTADTVRDFMAGAYGESAYASWMGYDNFVNNGNAENCSPSQYFVVSEYLAAKAAQLNADKYEDKTDWTQADVLQAFKDANITAWDHYTTYGQKEGLNPSNAFDNDAFFAAKCELLNAWQNEDGTVGYEGKDNWTKDDVVAVFQSLNINPIMNQPENPDAASLIIAVPAEEQVSGGNFNPWGPTSPTEYNEIPLVPGEHTFTGTDGNDEFVGSLISNASKSDLQRDDLIDGGEGNDMLTLAMSTNWPGFGSKGGMTNVETVNLSNAGKGQYRFDASGSEGVETWNLDGNLNLANIEAGTTVNLANANSNVTIGFAKGSVAGLSDAFTLGVDNVVAPARTANSEPQPVEINFSGIEDLTVNATGKASLIDISDNTQTKTLAVTGDGDVEIWGAGLGGKLTSIEASAATGDVEIGANGSTLKSAVFGSGDDMLTVNNTTLTASIDGGDGHDTLIVSGVGKSTYAPTMNNVEELAIRANTGEVAINGSNINGLETLVVQNSKNDVALVNYDGGELNVTAKGVNTGDITIGAGVDSVNFTVGDGKTSSPDNFVGNTLTLNDATSLAVLIEDGTTSGPATFDSWIKAPELTSLQITTGTNNSTFSLKDGSQLANVSDLTVSGFDKVDLGANYIGQESSSLTVDASGLYADFGAAFCNKGGDFSQTLSVQGSQGKDSITLASNGSGYSSVDISTGLGDDVLMVVGNYVPDFDDINIDLGAGKNTILFQNDATKQAWQNAYANNTSDNLQASGGTINFINANGPISGSEAPAILPAMPGTYTILAVPDADGNYIAPKAEDENQAVVVQMQPGVESIIFPSLTTDTTAQAQTNGGNVNAEYTGNENGQVIIDTTPSQQGGINSPVDPSTATSDLTVTASGSGDLSIVPDDSFADTVNNVNRGLANVNTVNIDTGDNGAGVTLGTSGSNTAPGGSTSPTVLMTGVTSFTATGDGVTTNGAQVGGSGVDSLEVSAEGSGGLQREGAGIFAAKKIAYTGSDNGDDVNFQIAGADSTFDLGAGSDTLQLSTVGNADIDTDRTATINMAEETQSVDILRFVANGTGGSTYGAVTVNGFVAGSGGDKIVLVSDDADATTILTTTDGSTALAQSNLSGILTSFGLTSSAITASTTTNTTVDDGVFFVQTGVNTGIYDVFMFLGHNGGGNGVSDLSSSVDHATAVFLNDVKITGIPSIEALNIDPNGTGA